jgi:hypothetical protein
VTDEVGLVNLQKLVAEELIVDCKLGQECCDGSAVGGRSLICKVGLEAGGRMNGPLPGGSSWYGSAIAVFETIHTFWLMEGAFLGQLGGDTSRYGSADSLSVGRLLFLRLFTHFARLERRFLNSLEVMSAQFTHWRPTKRAFPGQAASRIDPIWQWQPSLCSTSSGTS